jgi:hypothetical protein
MADSETIMQVITTHVARMGYPSDWVIRPTACPPARGGRLR